MSLSSVTPLDYVIVLIVLVSAGYAAWRGFLSETLSIFAWIAAAFACLYFGPYVIPHIRSLVDAEWLASLIAYAAVFLAVCIPLAFLSHRLSESVKKSPIGSLDRVAGLGFGVVRGLVMVGLAYLVFTYFVPIRHQPRWLTSAKLLPVVQSTASALLSLVPQSRHLEILGAHQDMEKPAVSHDPLAELIRKNEAANSVSKNTREPQLHKQAAKDTKLYGAKDRQALDRLVETGGSGKP
jgi:membrane protein required for colicin V production